MAKLNLEKFKENANKIIEAKSKQGLFSESQNRLLTLEIDVLHESDFRIQLNDALFESLCESIEQYGQLEPITIFKTKKGYQILNGHARVQAILLSGGESVLCMEISITQDAIPFYPYILNQDKGFDHFEIAYYLQRLLSSGMTNKSIKKHIGLNSEEYELYTFEYNLFNVLKNSEVISYKNLLEISKITNETTRDETLDHIVQKLINQREIENYLLKVKENIFENKLSFKRDGVKIKKNAYKTSIDMDERHLNLDEINLLYHFIKSFQD